MAKTFVVINTATAEELDESLYGVGPRLAKRIVEFRELHGNFHNAEDLAQVEGISLDQATMLSHNIDWVIPHRDDETQLKDWGYLLPYIVVVLLFLWSAITETLDSLTYLFSLGPWHKLWFFSSMAIMNFSAAIVVTCFFLPTIITNHDYRRIILKVRHTFNIVIVFCLVSIGLFYILYYQLYYLTRWNIVFDSPLGLTGLIFGIGGFLFFVPQIVVKWWPELARNQYLGYSLNSVLLISGVAALVYSWSYGATFPLWAPIFTAIFAVLTIISGVKQLRTGNSLSNILLDIQSTSSFSRAIVETLNWEHWLNARVPAPEEQRALKRVLDKKYPPSRVQTAIGLIFVTVGGYSLLTVLSGVIQWAVGKGLDNIFFGK